jgi:hypothetical protein
MCFIFALLIPETSYAGIKPSKYSLLKAEDTEYKYREINGEIYLEEVISDEKTVEIPEQVDGKPVTRLYALYLHEGVEKLVIPKTVTKITLNYFSLVHNTTLKNVVVDPENAKYQSKSGVVYTKSGKTLVWVPSSRESFTIPKSVTRIGQSAFASSSIKAIKIPDTVKYIGDDAFYYCEKLQSVTLSDGLKTISPYVFSHCSQLKKIKIPASVTEISGVSFFSCGNLKEVTFASGSKLEEIGEGAFAFCEKLQNITLPDSVKEIERDAFEDCTALKNITIPSKVKYIYLNTFKNCTELKKIVVKGNVKEIDDKAFSGVKNKSKIVFKSKKNSYAYKWAKKKGFKVKSL